MSFILGFGFCLTCWSTHTEARPLQAAGAAVHESGGGMVSAAAAGGGDDVDGVGMVADLLSQAVKREY